MRNGERLQQRKRQLRTVESADDRLERLQRRRQSACCNPATLLSYYICFDRYERESDTSSHFWFRFLSSLPVCVKSSEVLVSLVRCSFFSVLHDKPRVRSKSTYEEDEPLSTACTPCDECTCCNVGVQYVETTGMACSDSNMTLLLWSMHVHIVSALYRIFSASWTVSTCQNRECLTERINNGTPAVLSARAHLLDVIFEHFFLEADSLQTLPTHQNSTDIILGNTK